MLGKHIVEEVLSAALSTGGDFAEVFVEDRYRTNMTMVGGKVENSVAGKDFGVGIRIFLGFQSVYAFTNNHNKEHLVSVALEAAKAIKGSNQDITLNLVQELPESIHSLLYLPKSVSKKRKVDVMREAHQAAVSYNPSIAQTTIHYLDEDQKILVANSEGKYIEDQRVRTRLVIEAIAANESEMQSGFYGPGAHQGFDFYDKIDVKHYAREAARTAVTMLNAEECPSGKFPVVIDNEFGGVIFHEACGHGLEATSVAKKNSVFADRIGEQVAPEIVTYIDDGRIPNAWGSLNIDDEGEKTRENVLIENGFFKRLSHRQAECKTDGHASYWIRTKRIL